MALADPAGWFPFAEAKWWWSLTISLLLAGGVARVRVQWQPVPRADRRVVWAWVAFIVAMTLAALAAGGGWVAFMGRGERHLGVVAWVTFALLWYVGRIIGGDPTAARILRWWLLASGAVLVLWSALELMGRPPIEVASTANRLTGPFGSAAYTGAAALVLLAAALISLSHRGLERRVAIGVGSGLIAVLLATQSRAALVGLVATVGFVVWRHRVRLVGPRRIWLLGALVVAVVVVMMLPVGDRVQSGLGEGIESRVAEWEVGWSALTDAPLLGYGPEGYVEQVPQHLDEDYVTTYGRSTITDRAHTGVLDVALAGGLIGLGLYLVLIWFAVGPLLRRRSVDASGLVAAAIAGYWVHQLGLFPIAEIDQSWWLLIGFTTPVPLAVRPAPSRVLGWAALGVAAVAALVAATAGIGTLAADRDARRAIDRASDDGQEALELAVAAADRNPTRLRHQLLVVELATQLGDFNLAIATLASADADAHPAVRMAGVRLALAQARAVPTASSLVDAAVAATDQALDADPLHPDLWLAQGHAARLDGRETAALSAWLRAAELAPNDPAGWVAIGTMALDRVALDPSELLTAADALVQAQRRDPGDPDVVALQLAIAEARTGG